MITYHQRFWDVNRDQTRNNILSLGKHFNTALRYDTVAKTAGSTDIAEYSNNDHLLWTLYFKIT